MKLLTALCSIKKKRWIDLKLFVVVTGKGSVYSSKIANGVFGNAKKEKEKDVWVIVFTVTHH